FDVTGVQTCALPIFVERKDGQVEAGGKAQPPGAWHLAAPRKEHKPRPNIYSEAERDILPLKQPILNFADALIVWGNAVLPLKGRSEERRVGKERRSR